MSSNSNCNTARRRFLPGLLLGLGGPLLLGSSLAQAKLNLAPPPALPGVVWQRWGSGVLRRFGFRVYRATLWSAGDDPQRPPYALALDYALAIRGEDLVRVSLEEMRRLGATAANAERWGEALRRVFPDVRSGDRIVGLHLPEGARFYHQGRDLGLIADSEFANAFFGIWLDARSSAADVRLSLLQRPDA